MTRTDTRHRADPPTPGALHIPGAEHRFIDTGEVTLHAVVAGEGPLVVLLHGFPEFWWSWRHQLSALASAGFRAVAVDLRGCGLSDRPDGVGAYSARQLAGDVDRLIAALGVERAAAVVGHDWGGVIAYSFAARYPARVERLVILNAPHPVAMGRGLLRDAQLLRSAYMLALVLPALPERALASRDGALVRRAMRAMRSTPVAAGELEPYVDAARGAEWLRGGLNMYRAMASTALARVPGLRLVLRSRGARAAAPALRSSSRIDAPVLVIWGAADPFLGEHLARPPASIAPDVRVERIARASHDVMLDAPERVNALLLDFLAAAPKPPASKPSGS
jgi:pimeloyl-ACP methyl ester carboxylesterase